MKTTTISILRKEIKSYIDGVIINNDTVLVNKGADGAVIISLSEYNRLVGNQTTRGRNMVPAQLLNAMPNPKDKYVDVNIEDL